MYKQSQIHTIERERKTELKIVEMKKLRKRERERLNDKEK